MLRVIGFNEFGSLLVEVDGVTNTVSDDMANSLRHRVWDEWEMGPADPETGERVRINTIPEYEPPAVETVYHALSSRQFWLTALEMGVTKSSLIEQIKSHYAGDEAQALEIEVETSTSFSRDYPLVQEMAIMAGIEPYQLDAMWVRAATL